MPADHACPHCGVPLPADFPPAASRGETPSEIGSEAEAAIPPNTLLASGSNDENFVATPFGRVLPVAEPDPNLGEFVAPPAVEPPPSPPPEAPGPGPAPDFPAIDFGRSPPPTPSPSDDDLDGSDDPPEGGRSWPTLLLASYASAITLGLAWTLYQKPRNWPTGPEATATATATAVPTGHQAALSRSVPPPEPILAEHQAILTAPLVVGSLEVTPLDVRLEAVKLQRTNLTGKLERRDGGLSALILRLKLRNIAKDAVFAPLDQSFLRQREKDVVDTYIETADGERIYPYPLAVESEWSIVGQDFEELRPGESRVVSIVSAPEVPADLAGPLHWRVRLRTGIGRTDVLGVRWPGKTSDLDAPSKK